MQPLYAYDLRDFAAYFFHGGDAEVTTIVLDLKSVFKILQSFSFFETLDMKLKLENPALIVSNRKFMTKRTRVGLAIYCFEFIVCITTNHFSELIIAFIERNQLFEIIFRCSQLCM